LARKRTRLVEGELAVHELLQDVGVARLHHLDGGGNRGWRIAATDEPFSDTGQVVIGTG
jgi:hypothetical protein